MTRTARFFTFLVVLIGVGFATSADASATLRVHDSANFFSFDTGPFLVDPGSVKAGPDGTVAVWDEGLQQFFFHNPERNSPPRISHSDTNASDTRTSDTSTPDTPITQPETVPEDPYKLNDFLSDYHQVQVVRRWGLSRSPKSFFGVDGVLWSYQPGRANQSGTETIRSIHPRPKKIQLTGPVRSIVTAQEQWIIQRAGSDTPLVRWDPYSEEGLVDTAAFEISGTLIGVTQDGRYLTQRENKLLTYRNGKELESRTFSDIKDLEIQSNSVFVLTGNREVTRLNSRLTAQYTFFLPRKRSYRSLAVTGDTLYLTSPEGLFKSELDETGRSFFSQSSRLALQTVAPSFPVSESPQSGHRLWIDQSGTGTRLLVKTDTTLIRSVDYSTGQFMNPKQSSLDDLSRTAFQYFQVESTYWRGKGSLYYFFEEDSAVEQYDTEGRLIQRRNFSFDDFEIMRDLQFLGANSKSVYFSARLLDSGRGLQRFVLQYNWDGKLKRSFRLQHPFRDKEYMAKKEGGSWRYLGRGNFYQIHDNSVVIYDNQGYPRQTISNVSNPVDVARNRGTLFVLDLGGKRLKAFDYPNLPSRRHALPFDLRIGSVAHSGTREMIFSGVNDGGSKMSLYQYNPETFNYQQVLSHPKQDLHYPVLNDAGDSLFFWGTDTPGEQWTLYVSDTVKYSARPLKTDVRLRGKGFFSDERQLLFYPVRPKDDTGVLYHYTDPLGDTLSELANTEDILHLHPGGFTGYYAIKKHSDTYSIVSGYLDRPSDTRPLGFVSSDTLYNSSSPILRLMPINGRLYFSRRNNEGFSKLGAISQPASYTEAGTTIRSASVNWLGKFRGSLKTYLQLNGHSYVNLRTTHRLGRFYHLYTDAAPGNGGLQGSLTSENPQDLKGIRLRVDPGGHLAKTAETGRFSLSSVPTGYVQLSSPSYRHHFSYPVELPIKRDQYTVKQSVPMAEKEEFLLLERGLQAYKQDEWKRARIPLEAFRELTQKGPYYQSTDAFMEEIYRHTGDTAAQFRLFERRPELFSVPERLELYRSTSNASHRSSILISLRSVLDSYFRSMIRKELRSLSSSTNISGSDTAKRPVLSTDRRWLPRLQSGVSNIFSR
ncbi:MAG: hypothetical protein ABEK50_12260 [bacterium]